MNKLVAYAKLGEHHRHWYDMQHAQLKAIAEQRYWNFVDFVSVFAITSPRVSVLQNYRLAVQYMGTGSTSGMMGSTRLALANWEKGRGINGPKTSAFALAILGDPDALVLDVWMARALEVEHAAVTRLYNSRTARRRVIYVARYYGWTIAETQAAIWRGIRHSWGKQDTRPNQWRLAL